MQLRAQVLSENEREQIHRKSLQILAEAGIRYHGERSLPILENAGAKVDWDTKIARLP